MVIIRLYIIHWYLSIYFRTSVDLTLLIRLMLTLYVPLKAFSILLTRIPVKWTAHDSPPVFLLTRFYSIATYFIFLFIRSIRSRIEPVKNLSIVSLLKCAKIVIVLTRICVNRVVLSSFNCSYTTDKNYIIYASFYVIVTLKSPLPFFHYHYLEMPVTTTLLPINGLPRRLLRKQIH